MARNTDLQKKKEETIKKRFAQLTKPNKYNLDYIFSVMEEEFLLSQRTLQAIVSGEYDKRRHRSLSSYN
jgi:hypothetical protein